MLVGFHPVFRSKYSGSTLHINLNINALMVKRACMLPFIMSPPDKVEVEASGLGLRD